VEHVRRDFRLIVDLRHNTVAANRVEIVQLAPGGDLYRKDYGGTLHLLGEGDLHSGDWFVTTRVHPCLADAKQEAAAELERRGQQLLLLAERCHEIEGGSNG
jgi:hypothetical protein